MRIVFQRNSCDTISSLLSVDISSSRHGGGGVKGECTPPPELHSNVQCQRAWWGKGGVYSHIGAV